MKLGYNEATAMKQSSLEKDLKYCEKYGYDFIELRMDMLDKYLEKHSIKDLKAFFDKSRLKPYALNSLEYFNLKKQKEFVDIEKEFIRMCSLGNDLDCRIIIVVPSPNPDRKLKKEIKRNTVECLTRFSRIAEKYNVKVAFEYLGFPKFSVNTFSQCLEIIQSVNKKNVGLVLDCFHFHANGSRIEDLKKVDPEKIFAFHIDDAKDLPLGSYTDADRLWPGDGVIALDEIFLTLKEIGFDGVATIELFNPEYWEWDVEEVIKTGMEKILKVIK